MRLEELDDADLNERGISFRMQGPFPADSDPEGATIGFYTLKTLGIESKIVENGAVYREDGTLFKFGEIHFLVTANQKCIPYPQASCARRPSTK